MNLYSKPILEDLLLQLQRRFPDITFDKIPRYGTLDIQDVKKSPYFFN